MHICQSASYWSTVSYNAIWESGAIEDYVVKWKCSSPSWHLFKIDFFLWITHVFISCLWPRFHFTVTPWTSQLSYLAERWGMSLGGAGGGVHIKVNDTETISPEWKRNGRICWWRKGCKVMEGWWRDEVIKECKSDEGGCDGMAACWRPGQALNSKSTHLIMTRQGCE